MKALDLSGQKFHKLTANVRGVNNYKRGATWICTCECGGSKTVSATDLRSGKVKSCGCLIPEGLRR